MSEDDSQVIERHNIPIHGTGAVAVEVLADGVSVAVQDVDGGIICSLVVGLDEIHGKPSQRPEESDYDHLVCLAVGGLVAAWKEFESTWQEFSATGFPQLAELLRWSKALAELIGESHDCERACGSESCREQVEIQEQTKK